jgi:4-hydroxybenzoate polyprenyltransferase
MKQLRGLLRTMRPWQWTKNAAIFAALLFDRKLTSPEYLAATIAGFALLSLTSSTIYIINDLVDIEKDRAHPSKRRRPLPSGQLSPRVAVAAAVIFPLVTLPLGFLLEPAFAAILLGYLALHIVYSFFLKNMVIIDVMSIAAGFVLRVVAGVVLVDVMRFSPWLYVCTTLLALFLGFGKRRNELVTLREEANNHRASLEHYSIGLLDEMISIVTATTVVAYAFYTFSAEGLPENHLMMLTTPFVLYGIFRYLYLIHGKGEGGAPDEVLLRDRPLQTAVLLWAGAVFVILYLT